MFMNVRDMIKLKKFEKNIPAKELWCEEQQRDLEIFFQMIDDLIATAISSTSSTQAYVQLQEEKATFVRYFLEASEKYRHV